VWELRAICLWCTVVHVLAFILFVAVLSTALAVPDDPGGSREPDEAHGVPVRSA